MTREAPTDEGADLRRLWLGRHLPVAVLLLGAATALIRARDLDLAVARRFFSATPPHWPLETAPLVAGLYDWGNALSLGLLAWALVSLVGGLFSTRLRGARRPAAFVLLLGLLVPGLLVNTVLKPNWNRARPRNVVEFGGTNEFQPILSPPGDHERHSFPSGHVASASLMVAPAFLLRRRRRRAARVALALALAWTAAMGLVRIQAGGHWLSDCLWSLGLTYVGACLLGAWLLGGSAAEQQRPSAA
jgi:lipid A 4'-phosphatase